MRNSNFLLYGHQYLGLSNFSEHHFGNFLPAFGDDVGNDTVSFVTFQKHQRMV
jgi:hypothetical protein